MNKKHFGSHLFFDMINFQLPYQNTYENSLQEERKVWLEYHKRKWELQAKDKQNRKRRRIDFGDVPMSASRSNSLGGFLRRTARSIMDMPWQIVQVRKHNKEIQLRTYIILLCFKFTVK